MAKVLIFDLDPAAAAALKAVVSSLGHEAHVSPDGYSVLPLAEQHKPALFILEYRPPEADGFEIMQRLRSKPDFAAVPVIFATTSSKIELEMIVMDAPSVGHAEKPLDPKAAREAVASFLPAAAAPAAASAQSPSAPPPTKPAFTGEADLDGQRDGVIDLD